MSEENKYILQVKDLHTSFATDAGEVRAVNGVSFNLEPGKTLGIVGESGSGKSVFTKTFVGMLDGNGKDVTYTYDYVQLNVVRPTGKGSSAEVVASITVRR